MTDITTPHAPVTARTPEQPASAKDQAVNVAATAADPGSHPFPPS